MHFVCVCFRVWSSMADDAITQGGIGVLGYPFYMAGRNWNFGKIEFSVDQKKKKKVETHNSRLNWSLKSNLTSKKETRWLKTIKSKRNLNTKCYVLQSDQSADKTLLHSHDKLFWCQNAHKDYFELNIPFFISPVGSLIYLSQMSSDAHFEREFHDTQQCFVCCVWFLQDYILSHDMTMFQLKVCIEHAWCATACLYEVLMKNQNW